MTKKQAILLNMIQQLPFPNDKTIQETLIGLDNTKVYGSWDRRAIEHRIGTLKKTWLDSRGTSAAVGYG